MQIAASLRNTLADAIDTDIGATGFVRFYDTSLSTKFATIACSNPAFGSAATGAIAIDTTPALTDTALAAGNVGRMGIYQNSTDTAALWRLLFGVSTATGADVTMSNLTVATTDTIELTSLTVTVPAGSVTLS